MSFFNPAANYSDDIDRYKSRDVETYIYMYDGEVEPADELEVISS